ncbi:MAG: hypothetical protein FJ263_08410 [Planctomycetes bacterium]|nr:hypothetical protein [Planctomycetota bacterium]
MKTTLTMKRYLLIPAMIPVMLILWKLVLSADRLHAWKYYENIAPPTQSDYAFAALVFFASLLTPILIGIIAAIVAHHKKCEARWPVLETVIVVSIYLIIGVISQNLVSPTMEVIGIAGASCLMGGVIVTALINLAACVRQRKWVKFVNSAMVFIGGELYLLWLYAFIIYIDT